MRKPCVFDVCFEKYLLDECVVGMGTKNWN